MEKIAKIFAMIEKADSLFKVVKILQSTLAHVKEQIASEFPDKKDASE
jgi:hypothetical protein